MTSAQFEVEQPKGVCAATGRVLAEGEEYFGVLFEEGETFRRADYSLQAWPGPPEGSFCHFRSRIPVKTKKKRLLVDNDVLLNFFLRLEGETDPARIRFRFVLALILMRKKLLRYDGSQMEDGEEVWSMTLTADASAHRIVNPKLTDDQIDQVSQELTAILHGDTLERLQRDEQPPAETPQEPSSQASPGDSGETNESEPPA